MMRPTKRAKTANAGAASLRVIAERWRISTGSAARLLSDHGVRSLKQPGRPRFPWKAVWRMDGTVSSADHYCELLKAPFLVPREVAQLLGIADRTLRDRCSEGAVPVVILGARIRRFRAAEIYAIVDADFGQNMHLPCSDGTQ